MRPYFALRAYKDGDESYDGQIGSEPSPQDFLEALWISTAEWKRVLKKGGNIFVNLGDKMAASGGNNNSSIGAPEDRAPSAYNKNTTVRNIRTGGNTDLRAKCLMGLPWRYALGCIDDLGLILRAEIIWSKLNHIPDDTGDRVQRSHEQWFHLTKNGRYYSAIDELREPHRTEDNDKSARGPSGMNRGINTGERDEPVGNFARDPLGKTPSSVISVASEPLTIDAATIEHFNLPSHFAAFPTFWPYFFIKGWSPPAICLACGAGRIPAVDRRASGRQREDSGDGGRGKRGLPGYSDVNRSAWQEGITTTILGYVCECCPHTDHPASAETSGPSYASALADGGYVSNEFGGRLANRPKTGAWREWHLEGWEPPPSRKAIVLDPFGGTGTTAMVARELGRFGISNDMSADYCRLAEWRIFQSGHWKKARNKEQEKTFLTLPI